MSCVTGSGRPLPEENCQHLSPKPSKQRRCRDGRCPKWKTGNWGEVVLSDLLPLLFSRCQTCRLFFPPFSTLMLTSLLASMCICVKHLQLSLTEFTRQARPLTTAGCFYTSHGGFQHCCTDLGSSRQRVSGDVTLELWHHSKIRSLVSGKSAPLIPLALTFLSSLSLTSSHHWSLFLSSPFHVFTFLSLSSDSTIGTTCWSLLWKHC